MKKYSKMIGLILIYAIMPLAIDLSLVQLLLKIEALKPIAKITPTIYFGIFDPIAIAALILFTRFILKRKPLKFMSFKKIDTSNSVLCALIGLAMGAFTFSLINIGYIEKNIPHLGGTIGFIISGNIFLLVYIIAINSFYKEVCFRGLIFNELRMNTPIVAAIIGQAMVYGLEVLFQTEPFSAAYAFIGQILFGLIFYFGRSIWASVIAQISCTLGMAIVKQTALYKVFDSKAAPFLLVLSTVFVIVLVVMLYKNNKDQLYKENASLSAVKLGV